LVARSIDGVAVFLDPGKDAFLFFGRIAPDITGALVRFCFAFPASEPAEIYEVERFFSFEAPEHLDSFQGAARKNVVTDEFFVGRSAIFAAMPF
jgi:hypothetical protein